MRKGMGKFFGNMKKGTVAEASDTTVGLFGFVNTSNSLEFFVILGCFGEKGSGEPTQAWGGVF